MVVVVQQPVLKPESDRHALPVLDLWPWSHRQ